VVIYYRRFEKTTQPTFKFMEQYVCVEYKKYIDL